MKSLISGALTAVALGWLAPAPVFEVTEKTIVELQACATALSLRPA